jgi:hypothetical protein
VSGDGETREGEVSGYGFVIYNIFMIKIISWSAVFVLIIVLFFKFSQPIEKKDVAETGVFLPNSVYENKTYGFRITYPEGAIFAHANPDLGFPTRFMIPGGQILQGDAENIGIYIKKYEGSLEDRLQLRKDAFSKNGPVDVSDFNLAGQKGYKIVFTSTYTLPKKTREAIYVTVKDGKAYEINYFPVVDAKLPAIDKIVQSFEFVK